MDIYPLLEGTVTHTIGLHRGFTIYTIAYVGITLTAADIARCFVLSYSRPNKNLHVVHFNDKLIFSFWVDIISQSTVGSYHGPCTIRPIVFPIQIGKRKWNNDSLSVSFFLNWKTKMEYRLVIRFLNFPWENRNGLLCRFPNVDCSMKKRKWNNEPLSVFHLFK